MKKLLAIFAAVFLSGNVLALDLPKPVGYVNDFANVLEPAVRSELNRKLRDYEQATSIQVVVVTVPSLQGNSVEDFAQELFQNWKIGQKGKDNGVLILHAPTERKIRIHTGYGMEPDLTDSQCGYIIRDQMVPKMKAGDLSGGLAAGVNAVLKELGDKPFKQRLAERKAAEAAQAAQAAQAVVDRKAAERNRQLMKFVVSGLVGIAVIVIFGLVITGPYRRRKEAKEEGPQLLRLIPGTIKKMEKLVTHQDVRADKRRALASVKKTYERAVAKTQTKPIDWVAVYALLTECVSSLGDVESGAESDIDDVANQRAEEAEDLRNEERAKKRARKQSPKLLRILPALLRKAETHFSRKGYGQARQLVQRAKAKYREASSLSRRGSKTDWLVVFALLLAARACLRRANGGASSGDYSSYDDDDHSTLTTAAIVGGLLSSGGSSDSSSSSSSSSSSGGSSGGFSGGGGSSGGGGASGSY